MIAAHVLQPKIQSHGQNSFSLGPCRSGSLIIFPCVCRFERDVWATGDRAVGAGEGVQLPHCGGEAGESVHDPECGPGQRECSCLNLSRTSYIRAYLSHFASTLTYMHTHKHTDTRALTAHKKIKGHFFRLTCSSVCRLSSISVLHENLSIIDKPYSSRRSKCRSYSGGYRVHSDCSYNRDAADMEGARGSKT